jgi:hypothetical protein
MSAVIGIGVIIFVPSFLLGLFIAMAIENVKYWLDQRAEEKKITILPDGKGGYVALPRGVTYIPIKGENK